METVMERECSALGGLFQTVIGDMKGSSPIWDDFISKASKLQSQLRTTVVAVAAFLDAFQKVADMATNSRGGTRDIGSALTRMCMRHRSIEAKLRQFSMVFLDCLINPLQEQMEEWKRVANTLDKDHAKEYKKARQEIKKRSSDTLKLQKKAKKGRGDLQPQLDSAMQDVSDKYLLLEETEKQAVRKALVEERSRFCCFVSMLKPVVEEEMSMLGEITHLQTLTDDLKTLTMDPHKLPASSEQVIVDLKGSECTWSYQTPPSSPSTTVSRKSSMCSSLNSVNSSDSRSSGSHCHSPTSHFRYRASSSSSSVLPQQTPARLSSISSHDSGFISQDAFQSKSPSPMPPESSQSCVSPLPEEPSSSSSSSPAHSEPHSGLQQLSNGFDHHAALCLHGVVLQAQDPHLHSPFFTSSSTTTTTTTTSPIYSPSYSSVSPTWPWSRSGSGQSGEFLPLGLIPSSRVPSWKDWAKPGPYDQSVVNTLKRSRDRRDTTDPSSHHGADISTPGDEPQGVKGSHSVTSPREDREAHEELARALARGLQLDIHGSSRDSLQGSSGYSSQTNTPCCSEDTIPSQVSDCDYYSVGVDQEGEHQQSSDFDKSSTIPRNSDIGQSYRRMFQSKRPASTAGLPSNPSAIITPGVATIRRTPSSKPNLRRPSGGLSLGPIPIKPPMIPVKTPTVPEHPGFPSRAASEDGNTPRTPLSPPTTPLSPGSSGPLSPRSGSWETQHQSEGSDLPTPPPQPSGRVSEWERQPLPELLEETEYSEVEDFLVAIRRGVRLKRTSTNDRSAPSIH
ncbi:protein MTSS 1 isoform X2 [Sander lucioperca]|uniref:protein MTSS 1 isoform X2 n=1 Tax=Sander lucioperca TaxID=283035 RepID=UPI001653B8D5|nr:protein MTSS 1 isoform X2 [Sander lucioperca]